MSGTKDAPIEVIPVSSQNLVALRLIGSKITRVAVADTTSGTWHTQDLRTPFDGRALPVVADGVVVYYLGREVYAYAPRHNAGTLSNCPMVSGPGPSSETGTVTIDSQGHIYTFPGKSGKWEHIDVRVLLGGVQVEKK